MPTDKEVEGQHTGRLKEKKLTEDMPQDRKYWMTKMLAADGKKM